MFVRDAGNYPNLTDYVMGSLPLVYQSKKIVANMQTYGSLDSTNLIYALLWGTYPEIIVRPLDNNYCSVPSAWGCFDGDAEPNQIMLDEKLVAAFEANPKDHNVRFLTKKGVSLPIVGGTILHELCHWGNKKASRPEGGREMGQEFEIATYGVQIRRSGYMFDEEEAITGG